jgi:hypothetical protein
MKGNKSILGGAMQRKYMPAYANYFLKFLEDIAFLVHGLPGIIRFGGFKRNGLIAD